MSEDPRHSCWRDEFEKLGETRVRMIDPGPHVISDDRIRFSKVWLAELDASKRDDSETETLAIAKRANLIATVSIVISTLTAIAAIVFQE